MIEHSSLNDDTRGLNGCKKLEKFKVLMGFT